MSIEAISQTSAAHVATQSVQQRPAPQRESSNEGASEGGAAKVEAASSSKAEGKGAALDTVA